MTGELLRLVLLLLLTRRCTTDDEYVFKLQITDLKSSELDIIFLIDGSSSVGEENFGLEIGFVRKLLSDFAVSENGTGVSVVVFGNHPVAYEHSEKCELLNSVLEGVRYPGGGTNTLGAFLAARELIQSKKRRRVAVFLITDGFSNGGNPLPVAEEIKNTYDVMIFTIGIRTGNARELQRIASSVSTSYLMESFQEFDLLARKALHVDLKDGDYIPVESSKCVDRCDSSAACTCGTTSGQYVCRCRPGHYGTGKLFECHPCPKSTYWSSKSGVCNPCPDVNHMTDPSKPATNQGDCFCKAGFRKISGENRCEVITCPKLRPPENGYFVGVDDCPNVMNAACGVRCNVGYSLKGNSIRVCRGNGQWDGIPPNCHLKTCPKPPIPQDGSLECLNPDLDIKYTTLPDEMPVDTECTFNCSRGHSLVGSQKRICLPVAQWDGLTTKCKPLRCARLSDIPYGRVKPDSCYRTKQLHGSKCRIDCNDGFIGPPEVECITKGRHGTWSSKPKCIDVRPPKIRCPRNIQTTTSRNSPYGTTTWREPQVHDNSRADLTIWWEPSILNESNHEPHKFEIGRTTITYHAVDPSGNHASCNFTVTVMDQEPPVFDNCEELPPYLLGGPDVEIRWDKPVAFDNSGEEVTVIESHGYGVFPEGITTVTYTAIDKHNNTEVCVMNISVQISTCEAQMPIGNCSEIPGGMQCVMTCEEGYAFPVTDEAVCDNQRPRWQIPDCTPTEIPQELSGESSSLDLCRNLLERCSGNCEVVECNLVDRTKRGVGYQNRSIRFRLRPTGNLQDVIKITGENNLRAVCRHGTVPMKYRCAKCPKGTYHNVSVGKCEPCWIDSYNDINGSTKCFSCPRGKATRGRKGSKSISACKRKIPSVRHEPCRNDSCVYGKCVPIGKLRHRCVCSKGWIGARCRIPEINHCLTKPCLNGGTCLSRRNGYSCRCPMGFGGDDCDAEIQEPQEEKLPPENVCRKFEGLCENNGSCYSLGSGYRCVCPPGFLGRRCQFVPCDYRPCPNMTVCRNTLATRLKTTRKDYKCECPEGKSGYPKCLQVVDKCGGCKNNGTCSDNGECRCLKSWTGPKCERQFTPDYTASFLTSSILDYITLEAPRVDLNLLTFCAWVKTNNTSNYGTIFSYATDEFDNTLTLLDYSGLVIWINGQYEVTRIVISDGIWHHVCLQWSSSDGSFKVYLDDRLKASGRGLSAGKVIRGGGTIVLGQEQDVRGGGFSRIESFVGEISYVDVWSQVLETEEFKCDRYNGGDWVSWAEFRRGLKGDINILPNNFCSGCTKPQTDITGGTTQVSNNGSHLTLICQKGHRVVVEGRPPTNHPMFTRECLASGKWEDEDIPWRCARVPCNQPPRVPHARLTFKRKRIYKYSDQVRYHCLEGYQMLGNDTKTCLETGEWSEDTLECVGNHCLPFSIPDEVNLTIISEHVYDEDFRDVKRFEAGTVIDVSCGGRQSIITCLENQTWHGEFITCEENSLNLPGNLATISQTNKTVPTLGSVEDIYKNQSVDDVIGKMTKLGESNLGESDQKGLNEEVTSEKAGNKVVQKNDTVDTKVVAKTVEKNGSMEIEKVDNEEVVKNQSLGSENVKEVSAMKNDGIEKVVKEVEKKNGTVDTEKTKDLVDTEEMAKELDVVTEKLAKEVDVKNISTEKLGKEVDVKNVATGKLAKEVDVKNVDKEKVAKELDMKNMGTQKLVNEAVVKTENTEKITKDPVQKNESVAMEKGSNNKISDTKKLAESNGVVLKNATLEGFPEKVQILDENEDNSKNVTIQKVGEDNNTMTNNKTIDEPPKKVENPEVTRAEQNKSLEEVHLKKNEEVHLNRTEDLHLNKTEEVHLNRTEDVHLNKTEDVHLNKTEDVHLKNETEVVNLKNETEAVHLKNETGEVHLNGSEVVVTEKVSKPFDLETGSNEVKTGTSEILETSSKPEDVLPEEGLVTPTIEVETTEIPDRSSGTTEFLVRDNCRGLDVPSAPDNGYLIDIDFDNHTEYEVGTELGYKCRPGYVLKGQEFVRCTENGWSSTEISCEPVRCPVPPVHQNMVPKNEAGMSVYVFGNMMYYECDPGFSFYGNNVVRCLANGRWSRLRGKCARISCGKPNLSSSDEVVIGSSYLYMDSLRVMCPKSSPRESYEARCTHTGQWLYLGNCHQEPGRRR